MQTTYQYFKVQKFDKVKFVIQITILNTSFQPKYEY